ncbi:MAG: hypothetical protein GF311_13540 [Candidatus Lokiarchaeota archaeon]|nr:hypothetical protein [Candidatus Lokiarchaeota archaeon]
MSVPQELLTSIPEHETILYVSKKLERKRKKRIRQIVYIIGYIAIVILFLSLLGPTTLSDILDGSFNFWNIPLFVLTFIFPIFIFPLFFPLFERMFKREEYFLITDSHLYIYHYEYDDKRLNIVKIKLESIVGVKLERVFLNQKGDFGNLTIIEKLPEEDIEKTQYVETKRENPLFKLEDISDFTIFRKIFESILYEFGAFGERSAERESSQGLGNLLEFSVSKTKLHENRKRRRKLIGYLFLSVIICWPIAIFSLYFLSIGEFNILTLFGSLLGIFIGIVAPIGIFDEQNKMKGRSSPEGSKLVIQEGSIIHIKNNTSHQLYFSEHTLITYIKILKPQNIVVKWRYNIEGILIQSSLKSRDKIIFGPINNFPEAYDLLYHRCLKWKADNGLLYKKSELYSNRVEKTEIEAFKIQKRIDYSDAQPAKIKEFTMIPKEPSEDIKENFGKYLNPDEKMLFTYEPKIRITNNIVFILIGIAIFLAISTWVVYEIQRTSDDTSFMDSAMVVGLFLMVLALFVLMEYCCISSKRNLSNSIFLFSTKKVLVKYPESYIFAPYQNIYNIAKSKSIYKRGNYDIIINLDNPIETGSSSTIYSIKIRNVPVENPLLEQLRYLKEKYSKET